MTAWEMIMGQEGFKNEDFYLTVRVRFDIFISPLLKVKC